MFDVGWSELIVIGVVALIAIGPKELPTVLRTVGQWVTKIRRMAGEFQSQFNEAMREAELADLKKQFDDISDPNKIADLGALESPRPAVESAVGQEPSSSVSPAVEPTTDVGSPVATVDVPMPDPPPQPTSRDFLPAEPVAEPPAPPAAPEPVEPPAPKPAETRSA